MEHHRRHRVEPLQKDLLVNADTRKSATLRLLDRSPKALGLARRALDLQRAMRQQNRKIWPVARVAGLFNISERLLWKWIAAGSLTLYRRPTLHHKKGLTVRSVLTFLKQLDDYGVFVSDVRNNRRRSAEAKSREVANQLRVDEQLTPREFADRANVSVTTVHRCVLIGLLDTQRPTPHRIRICHWSAKYRKKRLTAKSSRKHH